MEPACRQSLANGSCGLKPIWPLRVGHSAPEHEIEVSHLTRGAHGLREKTGRRELQGAEPCERETNRAVGKSRPVERSGELTGIFIVTIIRGHGHAIARKSAGSPGEQAHLPALFSKTADGSSEHARAADHKSVALPRFRDQEAAPSPSSRRS